MISWYKTWVLLTRLTQTWAIAPGAETAEEARTRKDMAVAAISFEAHRLAAGSPLDARTLAVATVVKWNSETHWALDVHQGKPGRWGSDVGRARCLGQVHASGIVPRREWAELGGTSPEATRRCARATMRVLSAMARYCRTTDLAVVYSAYATGRGCKVTALGSKRAAKARALLGRM